MFSHGLDNNKQFDRLIGEKKELINITFKNTIYIYIKKKYVLQKYANYNFVWLKKMWLLFFEHCSRFPSISTIKILLVIALSACWSILQLYISNFLKVTEKVRRKKMKFWTSFWEYGAVIVNLLFPFQMTGETSSITILKDRCQSWKRLLNSY